VRIISGKYKGQTATLERRWPGGGKEWTVTLDGSYNNGIVKDDEIAAVSAKAKDSAVGEGETTYRGYLIYPDGTHIMFFKMGGSADQMGSAQTVEQAKKFIDQMVARGKDAVPYGFVPKAQKSLDWQISDLDEKIRSIEMKYGRSNSKLSGLRKKLKTLREENKSTAHDSYLSDKCLRCDGSGKVWISGRHVLCPSCDGSGKAKRSYVVHDTKAHDSLSFSNLFWLGVIGALIAKYYGGQKETVGTGSYDLRNYQPERKTW
jgi:polyhydroxyalkanoate synthesis regulator phasin